VVTSNMTGSPNRNQQRY